jgi:hypothetical protein
MKFQILNDMGNLGYEIWNEKFSISESYVVLKLNGLKHLGCDILHGITQGWVYIYTRFFFMWFLT